MAPGHLLYFCPSLTQSAFDLKQSTDFHATKIIHKQLCENLL